MPYEDFPKAHSTLKKLQGWLALAPFVDRKDAMFKRMASGFDKYWLWEFKQGWRSVNSSTPTMYSITSWNVREPTFSLFSWRVLFLTAPAYRQSLLSPTY